MAKLELFFPLKPMIISQVWGNKNHAYKQFGYSKHNGIDYLFAGDGIARAMCDGYVTEVGYTETNGHYVRYRTEEARQAENLTAVVEFVYGHGEKVLVKKGDYVKAGDPMMICGSSGFSTGPHLHAGAYFIDPGGRKMALGDVEADCTFDFSKYYNGFYAADAKNVIGLYQRIIAALRSYLKL